jgi:hypothetical protein
MNPINYPLQLKDKGNNVKNLQEALIVLSGRVSQRALEGLLTETGFRERFNSELKKRYFGKETQKVISLIQRLFLQTEETGIVDEKTAAMLNQLLLKEGLLKKTVEDGDEDTDKYSVYGVLRDENQEVMPKMRIKAFDKDIRSEQLLGEANTDKKGAYTISYDRKDFSLEDKNNADLFVRVYDEKEKILLESDTYYNAASRLLLDVSLAKTPYKGMSEYESRTIEFRSFSGKLPFDQLQENTDQHDILFLKQKTSIAESDIISFALSSRFEKKTGLDAAVYYGMLRENLPSGLLYQVSDQAPVATDLDQKETQTFKALMQVDIAVMMSSLQKAVLDNYIPYRYQAQLAQIQTKLAAIIADYKKNNPDNGPDPLTNLAGLTADQKDAFQEVYSITGSTGNDFWNTLQQKSAFGVQGTDKLQSVFTLAAISSNHMPFVSNLIKTQNIQSQTDLQTYAGYTPQDWENYLKTNKINPPAATGSNPSASGTPNSLTAYATQIASNFESAFPTATFHARLMKDTSFAPSGKSDLGTFFSNNPSFDLLNTPVSSYLKTSDANITAVSDSTGLTEQLKKIQRVYKIAPGYQVATTLLKDNIHSAQQIYFKGKSNFMNTYAPQLGDTLTADIYQKAELQYGASLMLAGELKSLANAGQLNAMPDYKGILKDSAMLADYPSLENLFGKGDFCECEDCRSVYGAASYLTDVLHFLGDRISVDPGVSAKDVLLKRRPDIGDIDLNCSNTNTLVPYIDLVNEILEDFISPPLFSIHINFLPKVKKGVIDTALLKELLNNPGNTSISSISLLSAQAVLSDVFITKELNINQWIIRDTFITLKISQLASSLEIRLLHQTHLSSDEISANPEYTNINAYAKLAAVKKPFSLPFDLFESEAELYLQKLGIQKGDLIELFRKPHEIPSSPSNNYTDTEYAEAYAFFKINNAEETLIGVADPANQSNYWENLGTVGELDLFESQTGLSYDGVLTLLSLYFINPLADSVIVSQDLSCDTNTKTISNLSADKLDRIHRFLRLWKKTQFSLPELDALLVAPSLGNNQIDNNGMVKLCNFILLASKLNLGVSQLLPFYQNIESQSDNSLYNQLFQNKAIISPLNPDFAIALVTSATPVTIADSHIPVILAATGISTEELNALLALTDKKLSLKNLSFIYRYAILSQALSLTVLDLLIVIGIINQDPFTDPLATNTFLKQYNTIQTSGFSLAEINYLLRQQDTAGTLIPDENTISTDLVSIRTGLQLIRGSLSLPVAEPKAALTLWLSDTLLNWDPKLLSHLTDILNTSDDAEYQQKLIDNQAFLFKLHILFASPSQTAALYILPALTFPAEVQAQISYNTAAKQLQYIGYMSSADKTSLLGLSADADYQFAIHTLFNASQLTDNSASNLLFSTLADVLAKLVPLDSKKVPERFAYFISKIAPVYEPLKEKDFIIRELSTVFKTDKNAAGQLFMGLPGIYSDFSSNAFINTNKAISALSYPSQYSRYLLLSKIAFVLNKLKIPATDLSWLLTNSTAIKSLDLPAMPIIPILIPSVLFPSLQTLINLYKLVSLYPAVKPPFSTNLTTDDTTGVFTILSDVLSGKATPAIEADLLKLTQWSQTDTDYLFVTNPLQLNLPADLKDCTILMKCHTLVNAGKKLGVPLESAIRWTKDKLSFQDSQEIKQALKSKYGNDEWLAITQPMQDKLRDTKRDALVNYILSNSGANPWKTSNELHSYFLVDVEMSHCQPSSRIVQANSAIQLFIQRCLMNLEPKVVADSGADQDWLQWKWMQQYRLWEANRQVFLYPENWIEPELRLVKSTFFKDLENDLQQNEVTKDSAEAAFNKYLEQLDAVARLEVKGMWYQDDNSTLHVIARTYGGDPKLYYYRTLVDNSRWTPWVKIDLDIKSDHIVPVVFNKRIYLFWAVFSEKSDDVDTVPIPHAGDSYSVQKPSKYWQIQMAFSEFRNGKWSPKKVSEEMIDRIYMYSGSGYKYPFFPDKPDFVFIPVDLPNVPALLAESDTKGGSFIKNLLLDLENNNSIQINCYTYNDSSGKGYYSLRGTFELDPCRGYPVLTENNYVYPLLRLFDRSGWNNQLDSENVSYDYPGQDALSLGGGVILGQTPDVFRNTIPLQMDFFDKLLYVIFYMMYENKANAGGYNMYSSIGDRGIPTTIGTFMPFFYQDKKRTFFVAPEITNNAGFEFFYSNLEELFIAIFEKNTQKLQEILATFPTDGNLEWMLHFISFYHPYTCFFMRQLFSKGIEGFMSRETQLKGNIAYDPTATFNFGDTYAPSAIVYTDKPKTYPNGVTDPTPGYPKEEVDFDLAGGYSFYNWELFFHAPLMIAERLSTNHQFEEASRWFNFIFNPTDSSSNPAPQKYWVTKPFFTTTNPDYLKQRIENIMLLTNTDSDAGEKKKLTDAVKAWRKNPFQPHAIAETRTVAYQKTVIMKYLDHLIAWGDYLFTQDTMESVNQATQLYMLAEEILGPKPQIIPPAYETPDENFYQLEKNLDTFSNALVDIENLLPLQQIKGYKGVEPSDPKFPRLETLYFCIPNNSKLLTYWDTVADRLYKIRHCLNIEGIFAPLALFAPPIDPGMLVRATAGGADIGSLLADLNAPLPYYRFTVLIQKAYDFCNEVKSLGASMLTALEKKDAEAMAQLQSGQQINLLNAQRVVKQGQIDAANSALEALNKTREQTQLKINYYTKLVNDGLNTGETLALALSGTALGIDAAIAIGYALSGGLKLIPAFTIGAAGFGGSPTANAEMGGNTFGNSAEDAVKTMEAIAGALDKGAALANTLAGYDRRKVEWQQQLDLAKKEAEQIEQQKAGALININNATLELSNQDLQIANAGKTDDFMRSKFTNEDLYNWMINQISTVFFQGYQLAYSLAKRCEQCYRYELALSDSSLINFGYWDSLKKGLLSGENLMKDLKKLENSYYELNKRELELTKHISLAQLDPIALLMLKENGECWVNLPEELFDMDYPGHYMRRMKSVAFSLPVIAGPYTVVSGTFTCTRNSMRISGTSTGSSTTYPRKKNSAKLPADDIRFRDSISSAQSIAISSAQNDNGLFELNLKDDRYLPFEGGGAISTWHIQLPGQFAQFDYQSITDLVIHLKYTARDGGEALKADAQDSLKKTLSEILTSPGHTGLYRMLSARQDFPSDWYNFLNPVNPGLDQIMEIDISKRFPYFTNGLDLKIKKVEVIADSSLSAINNLTIVNPAGSDDVSLAQDTVFGNFLHGIKDYGLSKKAATKWKIKNVAANPALNSGNINDLILVLYYEIS